jgi:hypothetical protein
VRNQKNISSRGNSVFPGEGNNKLKWKNPGGNKQQSYQKECFAHQLKMKLLGKQTLYFI